MSVFKHASMLICVPIMLFGRIWSIIYQKLSLLLQLFAVGFQMWHLELITALVILISSFRYVLLKTLPNFAESSEAANQQVGSVLCFMPVSLLGLLLVSL